MLSARASGTELRAGVVGARYETHGGALANLIRGLEPEADLLRRIFREEGVELPVGDWYPLAKNLRILERVRVALGDDVLVRVGKSVPEHAAFPPHVDGAAAALESLDVAFHMNHRRRGIAMFDPASGEMREGIGHYHCARIGERRVLAAVTSVYPCSFDRGILEGVARRFEQNATISHEPGCRANGERCCIYFVDW